MDVDTNAEIDRDMDIDKDMDISKKQDTMGSKIKWNHEARCINLLRRHV